MPFDKRAHVNVAVNEKYKIDRWSTYLVNNCSTHTTYEIAVQSNMNNEMELRVCVFFVYLFRNIVAFSFDMPEYFDFILEYLISNRKSNSNHFHFNGIGKSVVQSF